MAKKQPPRKDAVETTLIESADRKDSKLFRGEAENGAPQTRVIFHLIDGTRITTDSARPKFEIRGMLTHLRWDSGSYDMTWDVIIPRRNIVYAEIHDIDDIDDIDENHAEKVSP